MPGGQENKKRRAESPKVPKISPKAPKITQGALEGSMLAGRGVAVSDLKYEEYGGFGDRMDVRIPEVNPWNEGNSLTPEERMERSKMLFDGASTELDSVIPQALKDRAQRDEAKEETKVTRGVTRSACKLLDALLGQGVARSCLYQHVRPKMGGPGEEISKLNRGVLLYQVMRGQTDEYLVEEKEFRIKYPQYSPGGGNTALAAVDIPATKVLGEQISHYAARMEDPAAVARANLNARHFVLSLQAMSGEKEGDPAVKALTIGMVWHHLNGMEGDFNGRENEVLFEQGHGKTDG